MSAPVSVNNNNKADIERQIDRALIGAEQELEELVKQKEQYLNDFEAKKTDIIRNLAKYLESLGEEKNRLPLESRNILPARTTSASLISMTCSE